MRDLPHRLSCEFATVAANTIEEHLRRLKMANCETCGNEYDKAFEVIVAGKSHVFDSFECAIQALAPSCPHCGCRIIGHGVEKEGQIFCCVHCARSKGATELKDRT